MSERVEIDAEVLQYLNESAIAYGVLIQALLHAQEQRAPGFAQTILQELDKILGAKAGEPIDRGLVKVRARLHSILQAASEVNQPPR